MEKPKDPNTYQDIQRWIRYPRAVLSKLSQRPYSIIICRYSYTIVWFYNSTIIADIVDAISIVVDIAIQMCSVVADNVVTLIHCTYIHAEILKSHGKYSRDASVLSQKFDNMSLPNCVSPIVDTS
ncbi:Hypothetical predicted protein [Octopus vulgaris]|uniref:Uncharacterized protein n=1 Tax=Octopus vulgaris TaxID=6645 RepID=A0AA36AV11_OCTVU|nr:Hypothetical predicted protein [Octopus vulgaris]